MRNDWRWLRGRFYQEVIGVAKVRGAVTRQRMPVQGLCPSPGREWGATEYL